MVTLSQEKNCIVGNTFLATCCVVYCGPFSGTYRATYLAEIADKVNQDNVQTHEKF